MSLATGLAAALLAIRDVRARLEILHRLLQTVHRDPKRLDEALLSVAGLLEDLNLKMEGEFPPVPMILYCPSCYEQHIDAPDPAIEWENPPHRSHLCRFCKTVFRPADIATTGVDRIATRGEADTWP